LEINYALISIKYGQNILLDCWNGQLTSWSTVLQKLIVARVPKKFMAFYGSRRFITQCTRDFHWTLLFVTRIQFIFLHFIILPDLIITFGEEQKIGKLPNKKFPQATSYFLSPRTKYSLQHLLPNTFNLLVSSSLRNTDQVSKYSHRGGPGLSLGQVMWDL
jgi:hypothetical protein